MIAGLAAPPANRRRTDVDFSTHISISWPGYRLCTIQFINHRHSQQKERNVKFHIRISNCIRFCINILILSQLYFATTLLVTTLVGPTRVKLHAVYE